MGRSDGAVSGRKVSRDKERGNNNGGEMNIEIKNLKFYSIDGIASMGIDHVEVNLSIAEAEELGITESIKQRIDNETQSNKS